jgi:NADH-quinone oxidoreductase subunit J
MAIFSNPVQWILGLILIASSLGVILTNKPVRASLSFLLTLLTLAAFYLQLSAEFIGVMQILVYAGAILVIFMYVIVLFQDAYLKISKTESNSSPFLLTSACVAFIGIIALLGKQLTGLPSTKHAMPENFGTVQSLGKALYVDFFFPFEAVILLFLVALVGALYIGKKEK